MGTGRFRRTWLAGLGVGALIGTLTVPAVAGSTGWVTLGNSAAVFARPSAFLRAAGTSEQVTVQVYLGLRDTAGAQALLAKVSDPASPAYGHYLTPTQFRQRFARPSSDVAPVTAWLRGQGFRIDLVPGNHLYVEATGSVGQAERAFRVALNYYRSGHRILRAPASAPRIPASLGHVIQGVLGLADLVAQPLNVPPAPPPPAFVNARPCSSYWGQRIATAQPAAYGIHQPYIPCGYVPTQLRAAYGVAGAIAAGNDGTGVTVGIIDGYASPTIQRDIDIYSKRHGLPPITIRQVVRPPVRGPAYVQQGWYGEETLDVEAVHSMAPGASILYEGGASGRDADLRDAMVDIVDNHGADIISNSVGYPGEGIPWAKIRADNDVFLQAGAEGIGVYFSSGDDGDEIGRLGHRTVDWPASSPNVTAVGGTSLAVGLADQYLFETGWGTTSSFLTAGGRWIPHPPGDYVYGGGGGTSFIFPEPAYQAGVVPSSLSGYWGTTAPDNRVVPDVATDGDPNTGMLIGETQAFPGGVVKYGEYRIGGTSLSCPLFAGLMAIADQRAGLAHGFANPALYALAGTDAFRDVVDPATTVAVVRVNFNNGVNGKDGRYFLLRTMNQTVTLHTTVGFDDVTGLGTPNGEAFLDGLS